MELAIYIYYHPQSSGGSYASDPSVRSSPNSFYRCRPLPFPASRRWRRVRAGRARAGPAPRPSSTASRRFQVAPEIWARLTIVKMNDN